MTQRPISIGCDHAGFELKQHLVSFLQSKGFVVTDHGTQSKDRVDYPDFAKRVAMDIETRKSSCGVLVCGSGIGMAIAANKFKGVRAASIVDDWAAEMARQHNDLNVLCLGARVLDTDEAIKILEIFLDTPFEGGRHQDRLDLIKQFENAWV